MLLLDIIGIIYGPSDLNLSDLERSKSESLIVYHKGAELGYMLLWNTNRKSYIKSPSQTEPSRFTLCNIESTNLILIQYYTIVVLNFNSELELKG